MLKIYYEISQKTWGIDDSFIFIALVYFKQFHNQELWAI